MKVRKMKRIRFKIERNLINEKYLKEFGLEGLENLSLTTLVCLRHPKIKLNEFAEIVERVLFTFIFCRL
jgi:hypothetical protein